MARPAMGVATSRIVVGPVYHAAFFVPLVFAAELDFRSLRQIVMCKRKDISLRGEAQQVGF
jgi:hypothetical protein